jgi:predicted Zn-ribbon and HTH transcriptional regulator
MTTENTLETELATRRDEAHDKAIDALSRYKFEMFGYWAASWVKYNQVLKTAGRSEPNPFRHLVKLARASSAEDAPDLGELNTTCEFCGYKFLPMVGRYGCPNCLAEGLKGATK